MSELFKQAEHFTYTISEKSETSDVLDFTSFEGTDRWTVSKSTRSRIPFYGEARLDGHLLKNLTIENILGGNTRASVLIENPVSFLYNEGTHNTGYTLLLSGKSIDPSIIEKLPIQVDSVKIELNAIYIDSEVQMVKLKYAEEHLAVQAFKRAWTFERSVFVKIGPFDWEPVSAIDPMNDWELSSTVEQRIFTIPGVTFPVAITDKRNGNTRMAKLEISKSGAVAANPSQVNFRATPNPAINSVIFEVSDIKPGLYTIYVKNILGQLVLKEQINISSNVESIPMDLSELRKGSYLYVLEDATGKILSTKRLIILRP